MRIVTPMVCCVLAFAGGLAAAQNEPAAVGRSASAPTGQADDEWRGRIGKGLWGPIDELREVEKKDGLDLRGRGSGEHRAGSARAAN